MATQAERELSARGVTIPAGLTVDFEDPERPLEGSLAVFRYEDASRTSSVLAGTIGIREQAPPRRRTFYYEAWVERRRVDRLFTDLGEALSWIDRESR